ncbi:methylmalonyl-CoA carboxyltransferase [Streptomyces fulvorobeus]|uniref:Methylmalonyl-CoA carboxyltransferase n=2 Tax=Streptomyces TaxID=1883 RepID=A0A7J0C9I2_9ACTN|nr:methylmalonyl-CoA carboxyltransferase [Streptomyces fulvorobeus]
MSEPQSDIHTTAGKIADLQRRIDEATHAGSARAVEKQHAKGKLTARERIGLLLDEGSFVELDEFARHRSTNFGIEKNRPYGDGVVTGYGTVDGRPVCVYSQDFTIFGGSLGEVYGEKIVKVMDFAMKTGCPVIGINDGGGARIQEGVVALGLFAEIFRRNVHASGVIPQISLIVGPCAGGAVYSPAITDFTVMVDRTSHMFITGPDVIKTVTGEDVGFEELGGARTHNTTSGVAHHLAGDEKDAIEYVKSLLSYLPSNNLSDAPAFPEEADLETSAQDRELDSLIPDSANQPYDMHTAIEHVLDEGEFLETQALFAPNIITGFGRVEGFPVGIVANQPMQFAGCLDINASEKAARFVRTCDAFNVPVLTFVDVPGFLPGVDQEYGGIIRRGAKLIYAYAEATVPLITVITRKAFGGAYDVMGSKHLGADLNLAWPTAQIAVMGAQGAVNILHRRTIAAVTDPDEAEATRAGLIADYEDALLNPYVAAERGYVDAVVMPSDTRAHIVRGLRQLRTKRESLPRRSTATSPSREDPDHDQGRTGQSDPGGAGRRTGCGPGARRGDGRGAVRRAGAARAVVRPGPHRPSGCAPARSALLGADVLARLSGSHPGSPSYGCGA